MSKPVSIRERIAEYLLYKGISRYRFYKETGLSNGFLDKIGSINSDNCEKICYIYPDINPEWLLLGKGEMLKGKGSLEVEKSDKQASIEVLVKKLVELSSENTLLKQENALLKNNWPQPQPVRKRFDEEEVQPDIAAEPSE